VLRTVFLIVALPVFLSVPHTVHAAELWCMPDTLCDATDCKATKDEEMSVRLADMMAATTSLRSQGEDVPMTRKEMGDVVQWDGVNTFGGRETLAWRQSDMAFTYLVRWDDRKITATGQCEVQ
jgi:hypothetical protein